MGRPVILLSQEQSKSWQSRATERGMQIQRRDSDIGPEKSAIGYLVSKQDSSICLVHMENFERDEAFLVLMPGGTGDSQALFEELKTAIEDDGGLAQAFWDD